MAAKKTKARRTRTSTTTGDAGNRVRALTVRTLKTGKPSVSLSRLVHDVLGAAVEGVDQSIPRSKRSALREVFEGLREGVHTVASEGSAAVREASARTRQIADKDLSKAAGRIRAANDEFFGAVRSFASTSSKHVREELDALIDRAARTGPKLAGSARRAAKGIDGRVVELSGETARAGVSAVRRAASAIATGAGGFLEGVAEVIAPRGAATARRRSKPARRSTKPKAAKKPARRGSKRRRGA